MFPVAHALAWFRIMQTKSTTISFHFSRFGPSLSLFLFLVILSSTIFRRYCVSPQGQKGTPKNLCDKDFAELSGELSGAICHKSLVLLGSALKLFRKFFGAVRAIFWGFFFWPLTKEKFCVFGGCGPNLLMPLFLRKAVFQGIFKRETAHWGIRGDGPSPGVYSS